MHIVCVSHVAIVTGTLDSVVVSADTHHKERSEEVTALCFQSGVGIFIGPVTVRKGSAWGVKMEEAQR